VLDYRDILAGLFAAGYAPEAIVLGSPPHLPDAGFAVGAEDGFAGQSRVEFQRYAAAVKSIARAAATYYAPVNERFGAADLDALILPDHVHPNADGHAVIAATFAEATRLPSP
jgi:lysophospholipase L1-like esterase